MILTRVGRSHRNGLPSAGKAARLSCFARGSDYNQTYDDKLQARRIPCLIAFLHPFRIVDGPDTPEWCVSLDQINTATWDYVSLHEMVGGIHVGLESPYHMIVCRDGGLALPTIPELREDQAAVEFFNRCLAAFLLGGVYCEAVTSDGLDFGSVLDWKYVRVMSCSSAAANRFHFLLRGQYASSMEAIALEEPRKTTIDELTTAADKGRRVLENAPGVGGEFLLKGVTGYARRDWGTALANLWIVVEQLTSHLWSEKIVRPACDSQVTRGRIDSLRDYRTWTISTRHEMLFQLKLLDSNLYESLAKARKSRNQLSHDGRHPDEGDATAALFSVKGLFRILLPDLKIPFVDMDLKDHTITNPFKASEHRSLNPKYWMEIKKLPGEAELERLEVEAKRKRHGPAYTST